jgi:hypothetical protein
MRSFSAFAVALLLCSGLAGTGWAATARNDTDNAGSAVSGGTVTRGPGALSATQERGPSAPPAGQGSSVGPSSVNHGTGQLGYAKGQRESSSVGK